jgi:hypothetical protein
MNRIAPDEMTASSASTTTEPADGVADATAVQPAVNPVQHVHGLLRGRYWIAILLALLGAVGGAVGGYKIQAPEYTSTGLIRVQPSLPRVLYQNEQNGLMPMFDAYMGSKSH